MNKSKVAIALTKTVSVVQMTIGVFLVFMFSICAIVCLLDKEFMEDSGVSFLICCLVIVAFAVWLIILSAKKVALINKFKKYVAAVSNDPNGYIPDIAASLGASENEVKKNLELMIKKNFFANAFVDQNSNCIVIANRQSFAANKASQPQTQSAAYAPPRVALQTAEMVTIKCKGCGGINTIPKGVVVECDYCGSSIKGEQKQVF